MGYNTRRKSLSLPSLGIAVPNASRAHRPSSKPTPPYDQQTSAPPLKKVKWSHDGGNGGNGGNSGNSGNSTSNDNNAPPSPLSSTRSPVASPPAPAAAALPQRIRVEHTPPPSPGDVVGTACKVDTEGINDDIVVGVIEQLEKTGNRPHLIKDLATILSATNQSIAQSANPAALLSSRLSLYLKRPWTALSPCPLAKELIPVHPRKVFYFLTTQTRMALPESSDDIIPPALDQMKRLTPSISNPSVAGDDLDLEDRVRSPSPEVELFSPELDDDAAMPHTPDEPFSGRSSLKPDGTPDMRATPNRAPSPALEADERGFTETATAVRARGMSLHDPPLPLPSVEVTQSAMMTDEDETPEQQRTRDLKLAYDLFGSAHVRVQDSKAFATSPMIAPKEQHDTVNKMGLMMLSTENDVEMNDDYMTIMSPEMIDVDELDSMLTDY